MGDGLGGRRELRALLIIFGVALALRLAWMLIARVIPISDFADYDRLGAELAAGLGFRTMAGEPTAFRPPGLPFLFAAIYTVTGHAPVAAKLVNALLGSFTACLVFCLADRLGMKKAAFPAGIVYAAYPSAIYYTSLLATEVPFTFLFLAQLLGYVWLRGLDASRLRSPRTYAVVGFLGLSIGFAILVRPVLIPVVGLFALAHLRSWREMLRAWSLFAVAGFACAIVIAPWIVRNYMVAGKPVLATNGGFDFYLGNNIQATGGFGIPTDGPIQKASEWEANEIGWKLGIQFIKEEPLTFGVGILKKLFRLFSLEQDAFYYSFQTEKTLEEGVHSLTLIKQNKILAPVLLSSVGASAVVQILGLWGMKREYALPGRTWIWVIVASFAVVHAIFFGDARFHFPVIPLFIVASVHLVLAWLAQRKQPGGWKILIRSGHWSDHFVTGALVVLLLFWTQDTLGRVLSH